MCIDTPSLSYLVHKVNYFGGSLRIMNLRKWPLSLAGGTTSALNFKARTAMNYDLASTSQRHRLPYGESL
jgi:hypothetical protein